MTLEKFGRKVRYFATTALLSLLIFPVPTAQSELIIYLKNGKKVVLPFDRDEVKSFDFSDGNKNPNPLKEKSKSSPVENKKKSDKTKKNGNRTILISDSKRLKKALLQAEPGDDIVLKPGSYSAYKLRIQKPGTEEKPIRVRAETPGTATVLATSFELFFIKAANWIIEDLDIRGACSPHRKCDHAFHLAGKADNVIIRNNRIRDFNSSIKSNGVRLTRVNKDDKLDDYFRYPDNVVIANNYIYNTSPRETSSPVNLIDVVGGKNWRISGNLIADFQKVEGNKVSYGAYLKGNSFDGIIERNLILCEWKSKGGVRLGLSFGGGGTGGRFCEGGKCKIEHTNGIMRNNIILHCPEDVGIYLNKSKDTRIYNNTLINNKGIDVRFETSTADIINNVIFGDINNRNGGTHSASNNLQSGLFGDGPEAYFKNPATADLALKKEEDILDKGARLDDVTEDFCGNPREAAKPDIGAIEYGAGKCDIGEILRRAESFDKQ